MDAQARRPTDRGRQDRRRPRGRGQQVALHLARHLPARPADQGWCTRRYHPIRYHPIRLPRTRFGGRIRPRTPNAFATKTFRGHRERFRCGGFSKAILVAPGSSAAHPPLIRNQKSRAASDHKGCASNRKVQPRKQSDFGLSGRKIPRCGDRVVAHCPTGQRIRCHSFSSRRRAGRARHRDHRGRRGG